METNQNPYASPEEVTAIPPRQLTNRELAKYRLFQPGLVTVIGGALAAPLLTYHIVNLSLLFSGDYEEHDYELNTERQVIVIASIMLAGSFFCIYGDIQMLRVRNYSSCILAAMLMAFPCTSPCNMIGIVVGGWTLLVLLRKDTRAAFAEVN